jgi:hypothetical protein
MVQITFQDSAELEVKNIDNLYLFQRIFHMDMG